MIMLTQVIQSREDIMSKEEERDEIADIISGKTQFDPKSFLQMT